MPDWDGRELPPVATARMARFTESSVRTSLLTVPGVAGIHAAGFDFVGEAMGAIVVHMGWSGFGGCGYYGAAAGFGGGFAGPTVTSSGSSRFAGYRPYVDALYRAYDTAIHRMSTEAAAMGADGVVGVTLTVTELGNANREYVALGTAVRARSRSRPAQLFTTGLAGQDVAKLVAAGWVPASMVYGISVAVRHDDWATRRQSSWGAGNTEVAGYTELVNHVRADARHRFDGRVGAIGADGAIVSSMGLKVWEIEPGENHRDHVAESTVFGTAIVRFHTGPVAPTRTLTVLPLR